jgi:hypothetical protein
METFSEISLHITSLPEKKTAEKITFGSEFGASMFEFM